MKKAYEVLWRLTVSLLGPSRSRVVCLDRGARMPAPDIIRCHTLSARHLNKTIERTGRSWNWYDWWQGYTLCLNIQSREPLQGRPGFCLRSPSGYLLGLSTIWDFESLHPRLPGWNHRTWHQTHPKNRIKEPWAAQKRKDRKTFSWHYRY